MFAVLAPHRYAPARLPARTVAAAAGDGIGPEIMQATQAILRAADPGLGFREVQVGLRAPEAGHAAGLGPEFYVAIAERRDA